MNEVRSAFAGCFGQNGHSSGVYRQCNIGFLFRTVNRGVGRGIQHEVWCGLSHGGTHSVGVEEVQFGSAERKTGPSFWYACAEAAT